MYSCWQTTTVCELLTIYYYHVYFSLQGVGVKGAAAFHKTAGLLQHPSCLALDPHLSVTSAVLDCSQYINFEK